MTMLPAYPDGLAAGLLIFRTKEYSKHEDDSYYTLQMFFNDQSEKSLFESYRYYAYPDLLRMLSYSFPAPATRAGYINTLIRAVKKGDVKKISSFLNRTVTKAKKTPIVDRLLADHSAPTVLDYGCGLGYVSFEMALKNPSAEIILVDLDTIKLDFTEFRFKKHGIKCEVIRITEENQYPKLPAHDVCIATDVLEHLHKPVLAYSNIRDAMRKGGLLYGNFEDHKEGIYHVHPYMADVREEVAKSYQDIGENLYKKM